jgi:hypothetical protein|tara:strand:- start:312 stop:662 length:351 start_codon:yes stop_codon:yes gene_type:complete
MDYEYQSVNINQLNQLNHELINTGNTAMNDVLLNRGFINFENFILDVLDIMPVITDNELLSYVFYNVSILNAMNLYITSNNYPEINDMMSLVSVYRRIYVHNHVLNNRDMVTPRQV